jgi:hypothetical protein
VTAVARPVQAAPVEAEKPDQHREQRERDDEIEETETVCAAHARDDTERAPRWPARRC